MMDTAKDGKTYVLMHLDVKLPNRPGRDTLKVKLDMGAEANILPVRTYRNMFPEGMLADGTPDPEYLQSTNIEFECNKDSIIEFRIHKSGHSSTRQENYHSTILSLQSSQPSSHWTPFL